MTRASPPVSSQRKPAGVTLEAERKRTYRAQATAADPATSAWVSANAGAGKTHVLTMRVLRLLLSGTPPERILCLTYTKAAAAEMSKRVFDELARWVTMPAAALAERLEELLGRAVLPDEQARARRLFTAAIETPGGFKVQTIHAFCERLLQRFPLEAGVPPQFAILDDETKRSLLAEAVGGVLTEATGGRSRNLAAALQTVVTFAQEQTFETIIAEVAEARAWIDGLAHLDGGIAVAREVYARGLGLDPRRTTAAIDREAAELLPDGELRQAATVLAGGKKTDQEIGANLAMAASTAGAARIAALKSAFLTKDGDPRADSRFITKDLRQKEPALVARLTTARDRMADLTSERASMTLLDATVALVLIADGVLQRYHEAKTARAALDFDDLIMRTANLLSDRSAAEWVLYKLDGGLDHILVDEAQDTSPLQWRVIEALASEFFSGAGAREDKRTLFAVGDEKQSIYSFQGAAPKMFAEMGSRFARLAEDAAGAWHRVPLTLSFRTVAPLLEAVDLVFQDHARTPGLTAADDAIRHIANRAGHAGFIELWEPEAAEADAPASAWLPLADTSAVSPVKRLAERMAGTIRRWLDEGEMLVSENRPLRAGDIIILVRKRNPFAGPIVAALKNAGVPVAGADRMVLAEQIAAKDLIVLGQFMLMPEDDLALATVLKSPLFDLDDDDLIKLGFDRKGSLWSSLLAQAEATDRFRAAADTLKRWRARADFLPPYEFLSSLLDRDGMRTRLLERLGSEAADPLDELLEAAIAYDDAEPPSLQGFLASLVDSAREIKRDMDHGRDEVRVMTVHGAKGLEAPVVFLADTCWPKGSGRRGSLVPFAAMPRPAGLAAPFLWTVKGTSRSPAAAAAKADVASAECEERNRLLYVAMTRARDRLYVTGFDGKKGRAADCWYEVVRQSLAGVLSPVGEEGSGIWRYACEQTEPPVEAAAAAVEEAPVSELPDWARRPAPRVPQLLVPLAPSRLAPLETDDTGDPVERAREREAEPAIMPPGQLADAARFLRGTLTHALLQHLPELAPAEWQQAARLFADSRGAVLSRAARNGIVREVLAILRHPEFGRLFGPGSRAEVPIVAEIPGRDGRRVIRLTGQIDRLVADEQGVLIVDFKTNRPPPTEASEVAEAYLLQLAAYRLAIQDIFPERPVKAAILWTDGARILEIPAELLDRAEVRLLTLDPGELERD